MELSKERVIDIIRDKTIAMEVADDESLEEMITDSREAYKLGKVITTTKLLEKLKSRLNKKDDQIERFS